VTAGEQHKRSAEQGGCTSTTVGDPGADDGHVQAAWPNIVPIGVPFPVRTLTLESHFTAKAADGTTAYDLTAPSKAS
jgi:hypothetical protein